MRARRRTSTRRPPGPTSSIRPPRVSTTRSRAAPPYPGKPLTSWSSGTECTTLKNQLSDYINKLAPLDPTYREVKFVMTPYTRGMTKKVALVAWHYVQFLDGYDQNAITQFYESHVNKGPESVP